MLTPKLSEVIFFFLVLSATPGPAEPRGPKGSLAHPNFGPDKGKTFFLKCSSMYYFYIKVEFTQCYTKTRLFTVTFGEKVPTLAKSRGS